MNLKNNKEDQFQSKVDLLEDFVYELQKKQFYEKVDKNTRLNQLSIALETGLEKTVEKAI